MSRYHGYVGGGGTARAKPLPVNHSPPRRYTRSAFGGAVGEVSTFQVVITAAVVHDLFRSAARADRREPCRLQYVRK